MPPARFSPSRPTQTTESSPRWEPGNRHTPFGLVRMLSLPESAQVPGFVAVEARACPRTSTMVMRTTGKPLSDRLPQTPPRPHHWSPLTLRRRPLAHAL